MTEICFRIRPPGRGPVYFLRNRHPFNDYVAARLAEDKAYQYELFTGAGLPVPESMVAFNPFADERFFALPDPCVRRRGHRGG